MEECLDLESRPDLVRAAREFVRKTLTAWELEPFLEDAVLISSELVSNAVLHARSSIRLTLVAEGTDGIRIEVYDENSRMPTPASTQPDATSGRGLTAVAMVADRWGTEDRGDGKVVWACLACEPVDDDDDCIDLTTVDTVDDALDRLDDWRVAEDPD